MVWSAQMDVVPVALMLCSFSDTHVGMITALSDECKLVIGYLGTEPSLFRMPLTETRFIDFEQRRKELIQFEKSIRQNSKNEGLDSESSATFLEISASTALDVASVNFQIAQ